ncbi:hypothetical protein JOF29_007374 [Kribbella aluminosa]|uniref:Uncharacterized protein n=1 Tax=Kribbella aluminosa TaxID=416017 RepID=A0ABS4UX87_9ACTN|nr:hypothetical protein [Kribbella aluminosa]
MVGSVPRVLVPRARRMMRFVLVRGPQVVVRGRMVGRLRGMSRS